ncbi:ABC transporter ATP-binding protein [Rhodococcus jostii]|uniref:ABC transporter ATP-binding protein n=1 Tax=Rhodococcus jostii TaxID=132919 RepID=A0ABU4CSS1_RHOJO|nr:ABC transporter ATP-binding protein [Rhodococcus jostii]MDV6286632.1 ABC transporter ATP-binding protein [Rhodococcus jostii]
MTDTLLDIADLTVTYPNRTPRPALDGVSLSVAAGECVAVVGRSGSGKSTLVKATLGLTPPGTTVTASTLRIGGTDTRALRPRDWNRLRGRHVGLVLQDALVSLDPLRTIGREITEPLVTHRIVPREQRDAEVAALLDRVHLPHLTGRLHHYPHQLSGGERQRVLIASALAARPQLIIADEPTTALDVTAQAGILDLLRELSKHGHGILLITHDLAVVDTVADRVLVLHDGAIAEHGNTREVLHHPQHPVTRHLLDAIPGRRPHTPTGIPDNTDNTPVLVLDRVSKTYTTAGDTRGVIDTSLHLHAGEAVGVVGESGSGKSTLALLALGLLEPDTGTVTLHGKVWSGIGERRRRPHRHRIQLIDQDTLAAFDPRHTVHRILTEPLRATGHRDRTTIDTRITELLEQVGLDPALARSRPRHLSGGQRQRVAIARALATTPEILVCDEPVSALDLISQAAILDLLDDLRHSTGVAVLFISHDLAVVRRLCDRTAVMRGGAVVETGPTEQLWTNPQHPHTRALLANRLHTRTDTDLSAALSGT